jgi:hypothetical protein
LQTKREGLWVRDAEFLADHTERVTKFALPSPFLITIHDWQEDFSRQAYPTEQHFTG